ncbi:putative amidohydrolase [Hasllibacter halocynthiae]|uniref:Putative amidohydrolase n=1 Tax=Hasllibacter halocynthiae TaxID=595589 RepID=A0A2T0X252_9RHOB|nr:carbon-nitrogen hydrolase family protein [Hasllibacter halocynthiae]PRY93033.1 putative amidohydrolase [Hasllibacter halocynthiae]
MTIRAALIQLNASDDPEANLGETLRLCEEAARGGARWLLTPEATNCVSASRGRQRALLRAEGEDPTLAALRGLAAERGVWLTIGSLALAEGGRLANRSFVVDPEGGVAARYDKLHMFDVALGGGEEFRESDAYDPGDRAVLAEVEGVPVGLSICYDLRFPALYRAYARGGARVLAVPSAFTVPTGRAHWEVLLRARAIENGAWVLAPAQCGTHAAREGRERRSWGHSLAVDPWGAVVADGGEAPGVAFVDVDPAASAQARRRVPSLEHDRAWSGP